MTDDEYFNDHIPHRLNLLFAYRTRYSDAHQSSLTLNRDTYRDLFRGAKDICFIMTRFFCQELGVNLDRKTQSLKDYGDWVSRHGNERVQLKVIEEDVRSATLLRMLQAANGAVAHLDDIRVDHYFKTRQEEEEMISVINWMEALVEEHIYRPAGRDMREAMNLPNIVMIQGF
jgi:hypothetical protein